MLATRIAATGTSVIAMAGGGQLRLQHRALVLAEQLLDALERDRIDVPGIAGDVGHLLDAAVVRRVEAVVHAGRQAQRDVAAVAIGVHEVGIAEQILQRVGKSLGLDQLGAGDPAAGADDRIAGADQDCRDRRRRAARRP